MMKLAVFCSLLHVMYQYSFGREFKIRTFKRLSSLSQISNQSYMVKSINHQLRRNYLQTRLSSHTNEYIVNSTSTISDKTFCKYIENSVYKSLLDNCHINPTSKLLLLVSGGVDSMALLHILAAIHKNRLPFLDIKVMHFNHKKRIESDEEELFVQSISDKYGFKIEIRNFNYNAETQGGSFQRDARDWRRDEAIKYANALSVSSNGVDLECNIVTAHHLDDQVEGFFLQLLRGSHLSNLHAMRWKNGAFIKPLLHTQKSDIIRYMKNNGFSWREDESNLERTYTRNIVRLDLIPLLQQIAGGEEALYRRVNNLVEQSLELRTFLDDEMKKTNPNISLMNDIKYIKLLIVSCPSETTLSIGEEFMRFPSIVKSDALYKFIHNTTKEIPSYIFMRKVIGLMSNIDHSRKCIDLSAEWSVCRVGDAIKIRNNNVFNQISSDNYYRTLYIDGITCSYPKCLNVFLSADNSTSLVDYTFTLKLTNLPNNITLRRPLDGDFISLTPNKKAVRLGDFFRKKLIPLHCRSDVMVLAEAESNNILAVPPYIGHKYIPTSDCVKSFYLSISVVPNDGQNA